MTQGQFEREKNYRVSIAITKIMLERKLINDKEYREIDTMLIAQYKPVFGGL